MTTTVATPGPSLGPMRLSAGPLALTLALLLPAAACASPSAERSADDRRWLAGDLHVHTCFSHDAYCPGVDPPEAFADEQGFLGPGVPVADRFREAALRGLDFLAITDHNDVRSAGDPDFGSSGVLGIPGYESSLDGHAQVLGAMTVLDSTDVAAMARGHRAAGGVFQVNHPGDDIEAAFTDCDDVAQRHWKLGYEIPVDTIELLNPTAAVQSAEGYLECRLQRGHRVAVTGGSDSHFALTGAIQGPGMPTTWVHADDRSLVGVLAALRAGRVSVSRQSPATGGAPLLIEADRDGDGSYETMAVGEEVPGGTALRVRSATDATTGYLRVRAGGADLALPDDGLLPPGGDVRFVAPAAARWVRAVLDTVPADDAEALPCPARGQAISTCLYDQQVLAATSPVYVAAPERGTAASAVARAALLFDRRQLRRTLARRRGLRVRIVCPAVCSAQVAVQRGSTTVARRTVRVAPPGRSFLLPLSASLRSRLRRGSTLVVTARVGDVTLRRTLRIVG